jgi:hypothetical protein
MLEHTVPELRLDTESGTSKKLLAATDKKHLLLDLLSQRADLAGLPARGAAECQASSEAAKNLATLSADVGRWRRFLPSNERSESSRGAHLSRAAVEVAEYLSQMPRWNSGDAVSTLEQVLQSETPRLRLVMVEHLAKVKGPQASAALARRAVFDVCEDVRLAALGALRTRPLAESRPTLLAALRYPWAPVAEHAADAIVSLRDVSAVAELATLVDLPDPLAPTFDPEKKKWTRPELVRVNHLGNCLLCHAPSKDNQDTVRGPIPEPGKELPVVYYQASKLPSIRADVTYLKQDFSVALHVENAKPWPEYQRFDFMIRQRQISDKEGIALNAATREADYPQRQAVRFALRGLTGTDGREPGDEQSFLWKDAPKSR